MTDIKHILADHEYRDGWDTNCICGEPGVWNWRDWVVHMVPILQALQDEPASNMPPGMRLRIKRAQEQEL